MKLAILERQIQPAPAQLSQGERIAAAVERLRHFPQREMPVSHRFQDGVYLRGIFMPEDTLVVGHVHKTRHHNIVTSGLAVVWMNGVTKIVRAGDVFESEAGVQKVLYILDDMRWITVHANPTEERDIAKLEESLVEAPDWFLTEKGNQTLDDFRMSLTRKTLAA